MPADVITWSKGKALVATGIPVDPVPYDGITFEIGQANTRCSTPGSASARSCRRPVT